MTVAAASKPRYPATITVQQVFEPKEGRFSVGVKTDQGMFSVPKNKRHDLKQGETYEVEYTGDFKDIDPKTIRHVTPHGHQATMPQHSPLEGSKSPQPSNNGNGKKMDQHTSRPWSPEDRKSAFRCAQVTAFIRAGALRIDRNEIAHAIVEIDAGYDSAMNRLELAAD